MPIPIYLAMTAAEFLTCPQLPHRVGWMACHFAPGHDGLCNLPEQLPPNALLILDDSTPYQSHDPDRILSQLCDAAEALQPKALLLDFQRPRKDELMALTQRIVSDFPCTVVVSSCYAGTLDCPIFLPPGPLWQPLAEYLSPHRNREIWLDAAPVAAQITVTADGAQYVPLTSRITADTAHFDPKLHCHYQIQTEENQITFTLERRIESIKDWLTEAQLSGVAAAVGLYQELWNSRLDEI